MKDTVKQPALSLFRHGLTAAGGFLVARGWITKADAVQWAGDIFTVAGLAWGPIDEWFSAWRLENEARTQALIKSAVEEALRAKPLV